jgi:hypothetical protein
VVADNIRYSNKQAALEAQNPATSTTATKSVQALPTASAITATLDPIAATQTTKDSLIAGILVAAGLTLPALAIGFPTRIITRMTQVRLKSATANAAAKPEVKEFIEFETISNQMWRGPWGRPRLIPRSDVSVVRTRGEKGQKSGEP